MVLRLEKYMIHGYTKATGRLTRGNTGEVALWARAPS